MLRPWCWVTIAAVLASGGIARGDDLCALGGDELELAGKMNQRDRQATTKGLRRDPGNLQLHRRALAEYAVGKRPARDVSSSILVLIESCPSDSLLAHPRVVALRRPDLARAWERSIRRQPTTAAIASYYAFKLRGKAPTIRPRAHKGIAAEQFAALQASYAQLSRVLGKRDRTARVVARRAHRVGEMLLEDATAARVSRAKMYPLFGGDPEPVPTGLIADVARAALDAGRPARAEKLATLALMAWLSTGHVTTKDVDGAIAVLADIATTRGDLSLARALTQTIDERNDPWR